MAEQKDGVRRAAEGMASYLTSALDRLHGNGQVTPAEQDAMAEGFERSIAHLTHAREMADALVEAEAGLDLAQESACRCTGGFQCSICKALDAVVATLARFRGGA